MFAKGTRFTAQMYCKRLQMFAEGTRLAAQIYCKLLQMFAKGTRLTVIAQVYANYCGCLLTDCIRLSHHQGQPELLHLH